MTCPKYLVKNERQQHLVGYDLCLCVEKKRERKMSVCECVCVCVCERERKRGRDVGFKFCAKSCSERTK